MIKLKAINRILLRTVLFFVIISSYSLFVNAAVPPNVNLPGYDQVKKKITANKSGPVKIMIKLKDRTILKNLLRQQKDQKTVRLQATQLQAISNLQERVISKLTNQTGIKKFKVLPYLSLNANQKTLDELSVSPEVESIEIDTPAHFQLSDSIPVVGGSSLDGTFKYGNYSYTGSGKTVAIIDTGIDKRHRFLEGKVIREACFSSNVYHSEFDPKTGNPGVLDVVTLCSNNLEQQVGVGAGEPCTQFEKCFHGTAVAGIATGKRTVSGQGLPINGVAQNANLISIKVASMGITNFVCFPGAAPCLYAYHADIIRALEHLYLLQLEGRRLGSFDIASVNISINDSIYLYNQICDGGAILSAYYLQTLLLNSVGTAVVAATGNNGSFFGIGRPACVSNVVAVGATNRLGTAPWVNTNTTKDVDLLAPGQHVVSSNPPDQWISRSGTSYAAPHVAGAFAVLKSAKNWTNQHSVFASSVLFGLKITGIPINSCCNSPLVTPLIQINNALTTLPPDPP